MTADTIRTSPENAIENETKLDSKEMLCGFYVYEIEEACGKLGGESRIQRKTGDHFLVVEFLFKAGPSLGSSDKGHTFSR